MLTKWSTKNLTMAEKTLFSSHCARVQATATLIQDCKVKQIPTSDNDIAHKLILTMKKSWRLERANLQMKYNKEIDNNTLDLSTVIADIRAVEAAHNSDPDNEHIIDDTKPQVIAASATTQHQQQHTNPNPNSKRTRELCSICNGRHQGRCWGDPTNPEYNKEKFEQRQARLKFFKEAREQTSKAYEKAFPNDKQQRPTFDDNIFKKPKTA